MKIVIIGGVAGGATAAARLRRLDEDAQIVVIERGEYISYANCGLPYYIGDAIKARESLLIQTPQKMWDRYRVDTRVKNEAISIDREKKIVRVRSLDDGREYEESYDTLVLATGSSPIRPRIPGIESPRIMTLWTVPDADQIRSAVHDKGAKSAVVVGGGFIGLEVAENLHAAGLKVSIVEMGNQVMAPIDFEMAQQLHENIEDNGVDLHLGDGVDSFSDTGFGVTVRLKSGKELAADIAVLSIGIRPNNELAKAAGLELNAVGGVVTDEMLRTSDPAIYALGDVAKTEDSLDKSRVLAPLAGPANKQARIVANNICGAGETYNGTLGTSITKVFDLAAAATGSSEKSLIRSGLERGKDYEAVWLTQKSHAGYYPGSTPMTIKLLFSMDGKTIYGAQIVGTDGVDKRIDTISAAIRLNAGIKGLKEMECAYAPPYSSAKDPVNMAGFVAENVLTGKVRFSSWDLADLKDPILLDVREDAERDAFEIPGTLNIPLGQLRERLPDLDSAKPIVVFCSIGERSYVAARLLMQRGFGNVLLYPGGVHFYRSVRFTPGQGVEAPLVVSIAEGKPLSNDPAARLRVDCTGLQCPGPIMRVHETIRGMKDGEVAEITASDPGFTKDISAWCRRTGNMLVAVSKKPGEYTAVVRKGTTEPPAAAVSPTSGQGKTIIVFDGDMDKVMAAFIIANGAAAMGRPVTMFFTFWGLNALKKPKAPKTHKSFMESMFGIMLPRGVGKLKLSKLNMLGLGSVMMKGVMRSKNVDSLDTMIEKARKAGVRLVACTMSMDVMGVRPEELIDGVELAGVGSYLGDAEESNVNLFI